MKNRNLDSQLKHKYLKIHVNNNKKHLKKNTVHKK